ncbi:MAG: efflux RND transporter periplasmic adaptor subunit [bacterium]|nr:efflux RND transporter periplasmic adaptor subunit [bacterium]
MRIKLNAWQFTLPLLLLMAGCQGKNGKEFLGSGTLEADEVFVSSLLAGRIDSLTVDEGDPVTEGQVLAKLDVRKLAEQVHQSEAGLEEIAVNRRIAQRSIEQAQEQHNYLVASLNRQKNLLESGSSTQQMVDDLNTQEVLARSRVRAAQEQLQALEAKEKQVQATLQLIQLQIADGSITAPRSGIITEKYVEIGENVAPGSSLFKIADLKKLWLKVYLSEKELGLVPLGTRLKVQVDALRDQPFEGKVVWVSPRSEFTPSNIQTRESRAELVFAVKVAFNNPELKAMIGMPAEVVVP